MINHELFDLEISCRDSRDAFSHQEPSGGGDEWQWRHNDVTDDDIEMINKYEFCDHKKYETVI